MPDPRPDAARPTEAEACAASPGAATAGAGGPPGQGTGAGAGDRLGLTFAVLAASGLGLAVAVARLAYEGGTNGLTVASSRACLAVLVLAVFCRLTGRRLRLPLGVWLNCAALGLLMSMMFYGNIAAVQYIPVGLTALLFYTYPPMVAVLHVVFERQRLAAGRWLTLLVAFAGLAVMLGVSLDSADGRGMALALAAAGATAWNSVWVAARMRGVDPVVMTFHMAVVAAVVLVTVLLASSAARLPVSAGGWLGLAGVAVLQSVSLPFYFVAISRIGALRSAMFSNVQPVVSIVAAWLLYRELLGATQVLGGIMVLGAIVVGQWLDTRRPR